MDWGSGRDASSSVLHDPNIYYCHESNSIMLVIIIPSVLSEMECLVTWIIFNIHDL